jgi:hypothetical protein
VSADCVAPLSWAAIEKNRRTFLILRDSITTRPCMRYYLGLTLRFSHLSHFCPALFLSHWSPKTLPNAQCADGPPPLVVVQSVTASNFTHFADALFVPSTAVSPPKGTSHLLRPSHFPRAFQLFAFASICTGATFEPLRLLIPSLPLPIRFFPNLTRAKRNLPSNDTTSLDRVLLLRLGCFPLLSFLSRSPPECPCPAAMSSSEINQVLANSLSPGESSQRPRPLSLVCSTPHLLAAWHSAFEALLECPVN